MRLYTINRRKSPRQSDNFLSEKQMRASFATAWRKEITNHFYGLQLESDPFADCQAILEDAQPFEHVTELRWHNPNLDQQWAVSSLSDCLPNLKLVTISGCKGDISLSFGPDVTVTKT